MLKHYKDAAENYIALGGKYFGVKFELTHDSARKRGLHVFVWGTRLAKPTKRAFYSLWLPFGI